MPVSSPSVYHHARRLIKEKGFLYAARIAAKMALQMPFFVYYRLFNPSAGFEVAGRKYHYFYSFLYNRTWRTERSVEIPVMRDIVQQYRDKDILEIGNTLSYYIRCSHDTVDKYEQTQGVINQDVVDFRPAKRYDLIFSISTLEHVGWDETPKQPEKFVLAVDNLKTLLKPGGTIVFTVPLGYNSFMDQVIRENELKLDGAHYLKRLSMNKWVEVSAADTADIRYDYPFPAANGIIIGTIRQS